MNKQAVIITVGLPRSGKSTWSLKQGFPIVNRDAIRLAHHGQAFLIECEDYITYLERLMVKALLFTGHEHIIIDATHVSVKRRRAWVDYLAKYDVNITYKYFDTDKYECIKRANNTDKSYLVPIIERMSKDLEALTVDELKANTKYNLK